MGGLKRGRPLNQTHVAGSPRLHSEEKNAITPTLRQIPHLDQARLASSRGCSLVLLPAAAAAPRRDSLRGARRAPARRDRESVGVTAITARGDEWRPEKLVLSRSRRPENGHPNSAVLPEEEVRRTGTGPVHSLFGPVSTSPTTISGPEPTGFSSRRPEKGHPNPCRPFSALLDPSRPFSTLELCSWTEPRARASLPSS